ncbi:MAG: bifunctional precorrin-2 dehydrogenase/sirohydrochlorin ferrochelatase [Saccharolobus sp.]
MAVRNFYPIFVDISGFNVLVVGGGKIGSKRALSFKKYGANVTVFSLDFSQELKDSHINMIQGDASLIDDNLISRYDIILTCTNNPDLNKKICEKSKKLRKLCNNPTNPEDSNFIVPIFYSDENFEIAITSRGKSSILSKEILSKITSIVNNSSLQNLLNSMYNVKILLKRKIQDPSVRYLLYHRIYDDETFKEYATKGDLNKALDRAEEIIHEYR